MPAGQKLTDRVHEAVHAVLEAGDIAVDATVGNGHDTLWLARCVGPTGQVFGFDLQQRAIAATRYRLEQAECERQVTLLQRSHADLAVALPPAVRGTVRAVLFNLGYLPGGDKAFATRPGTTCAALDAARQVLAPTGLLSVMAYRGHPGGEPESEAVRQWFADQEDTMQAITCEEAPNGGPVWWLLRC